MSNRLHPFETVSGSEKLGRPLYLLMLLAISVLSAFLIAKMGIVGGLMLIMLPFIVVYINYLFRTPILGLYTTVGLGFTLLGLGRYIGDIPIGLAMDGILILTFIALIFNKFYERVDWSRAKKDIMLLAVIWFGYFLFQLVNPEAKSVEAWFTGRGIGIYMLLIVPLVLLLIDTTHKLDVIFYLWGVFSLLASAKGIMQLLFGVDPWEHVWLSEPGNFTTHMLFGKLRVFSFLSDAGQFGANQAYSAVVATIVSLVEKNWRKKMFFIVVALFGFYGLVISGTRGAISVPLAGFMAFFVLRKNLVVMVSGFLLLLMVFVFFKYTNIGQGTPAIGRMRSAFDPNNASLQVRLENQKKLSVYLATRPFGGGVGHAGGKARRFLPNAVLSNIATDSWYVLIWAEQGVVGLSLHLFILFYVVLKSSYRIMFKIRDPILKMKMAALTSGMFGIMVASYGNAVLGQMPTSILIYATMAILLNSDKLDTPAVGNAP
jgi:hypothetical protein